MSVLKITVIFILAYFVTLVESQGCDGQQQQTARGCINVYYGYDRTNENQALEARYNSTMIDMLPDNDHMSQCQTLSTLANCLKMNNATGCVTGPTFSSILAANFTPALYNGATARSMNCVNNSRSIWRGVQCAIAGQVDSACIINPAYIQCPNLQAVLNCQLPKAKKECGVFASEYVCQRVASLANCGTQICNMSALNSISMDKQMLFASGDRNTISLILGLAIMVLGLSFW